MTPEEARQKLAELCEEIKNDYRPISEDDLHRAKKQVLQATDDLIRLIQNDPAKNRAEVWMDRLGLKELRKTLLDKEGPDAQVLEATWGAFGNQEYGGVRWKIFEPLRLALRRYYLFQILLQEVEGRQRYRIDMEKLCSTLPGFIDVYSRNVIEHQDGEIAKAIKWLEDVSEIEPRTVRLAELARTAFSGPNLRVRMSGDFIGAGFQTTIVDEPTDIRENILGTQVVGKGTFSTDSRASLLETSHHAGISVNVAGTISSLTTGYNHPVTLNTKTEGTIRGDKRIVFSADRIFTTPAQTRAKLQAMIYNVRVDGGPLVQCIARKQVAKRQGASQAESRRRTEMRMGHRIDERIDARIEELNRRYQEKLRVPLVKSGLFPRIWDLSSSAEAVHLTALIGDSSQPSAMNPPPVVEGDYDMFVQIHQSALNNAAVLKWAGNYFEEDEEESEFVRKLKERCINLRECMQRPKEEEPLRLTFSNEAPIRVGFDDNKINMLFQVREFYTSRSGADENAPLQKWAGMNIFLTYDVKIENVDGDDVVVLERSGEPVFTPRLGDGPRFTFRTNPIRTVVQRRVEAQKRKFVTEPWYPEGEWEGKGKLVPCFATTCDGWLIVGLDWVPVEE